MEWVKPGFPGEGNLTCFNNGLGRGNYSTADEFTPAVDANGNYTLSTGSAALPLNFAWTYTGDTTNPLYSENISGAYRLPNGNTIICSGTIGEFREVTPAKEVVWKYICPVELTGRITQGNLPAADAARAGETMNSVFRVYKYPLDYAAFKGRDLTPGDFIELYPAGIESTYYSAIEARRNPFKSTIELTNTTGSENYVLTDASGKSLWRGKNIEQQSFSYLKKGVYLLVVNQQMRHQVLKLIKQ